MKYIKKFEAKRTKDGIKAEWVNNKSALELLKKEWEELEDRSPWDFDYFWNKISNYSDSSEFHEFERNFERDKSNNGCEASISVEYYNPDYNGNKPILVFDPEWRKRNGHIRIYTNTSGASGGSCYDEGPDDGARPYDTGNSVSLDSFLSVLENILYGIFGKNRNPGGIGDVEKLIKIIGTDYKWLSYIKEDGYTNYEYYGNYDNYSYMIISLWDLYKFLVLNDAF